MILLLVIVLLAVGFGIAKLIALPFGGVGTAVACCSASWSSS